VETLVDAEREWVPRGDMQSLYIRPYSFSSEALLGVRAAGRYRFAVILSPVGAYYASGFRPVKIFVSEKYVRAAPGGTGEAKAAGNYAGSLIAGKEAQEAGCSQVLWLDAAERKYIEEIGAMNVMFVIDGTLITSPLDGAILPGITRDSILTLARENGMRVEERPLSIDELIDAIGRRRCSEAFGCGTAAVVTPIRSFRYKGRDYEISDEPGPVAREMLSTITEIQWGRRPDPYSWMRMVRRLSPQLAGVTPTGSRGE